MQGGRWIEVGSISGLKMKAVRNVEARGFSVSMEFDYLEVSRIG